MMVPFLAKDFYSGLQMGFGMTVPEPEWHPEGLHMFDVGREGQLDHEEIICRIAVPLSRLLQAASGDCKDRCKVGLRALIC